MNSFSENMETKKKSSVPFIDICAYVECSNNRQQVSLYSFPKKSNPLCAEWLSRICNPALKYYSSSTLRRMGVCEKHFTPEMFKPPIKSCPNRRKTLKRTAIPEPSDHLVQKWREKLKQFMAARQIKRDNNIEEKEEAEKGKGREKEEEPQQQQQKTKKERQQQQWKEPGKEQRKKLGKEGQQQQRKWPGKEGQQRKWKEPEVEYQQQQQEMENEKQQQQRQEMENEKQRQQWQDIEEEEEERQAAAKEIEDQEIEMFVTKPTRVYTKQPFSFSDDEDDGMEWVTDEPPANCVALGESPLKKTPCEMKLERENVKLKRENKCLKIQLKYLKRKLKRSIISRDRLSNELRKISK